MPSASRIEALSGSSFFAFSSGTVACAFMPRRRRLRPSWYRSYASDICKQSFHLVEDRNRDRGLRRLRHPPVAVARHEHHLVVGALERNVGPRDVVEDDKIRVLRLEHVPLALEPPFAEVGAEGDEQLPRALLLAQPPGD